MEQPESLVLKFRIVGQSFRVPHFSRNALNANVALPWLLVDANARFEVPLAKGGFDSSDWTYGLERFTCES